MRAVLFEQVLRTDLRIAGAALNAFQIRLGGAVVLCTARVARWRGLLLRMGNRRA